MTSHFKAAPTATKITIIHYKTAQPAAIYGLQDLFSVALITHKHSSRRPNLLSLTYVISSLSLQVLKAFPTLSAIALFSKN